MKILFIYSLQENSQAEKPINSLKLIHFGISYISAYLAKHSHQTKLLVLTRETKTIVIQECLKNFQPEVICFTSVATEFEFILNIGRYIKSNYPHIYLLIGGTHVSLNPDESILEIFDAVCIGEGEVPTLEFVNQLEKGNQPAGIANLWIKRGNRIEKNLPRPFIKDIDFLPFPDRKIWIEWVEDREFKNCAILLGRGCPFQCTYCCNHALKNVSKGSYFRLRSVENIIDELEKISAEHPCVETVYLEVETFGANLDWAIKLCSALRIFNKKNKISLSYGVNLRITPNVSKYEPLFVMMKKSNFSFVNIGLESGSEKIRSKILRRHYSNDDIITATMLARKYGLKVAFFNLMGIPGETFDDFQQTVKMNRICLPDWHYLSIFYPYPGTELFSICKEQGLIQGNTDQEQERTKAILDLKGFNKQQIHSCFVWFDYLAFRGYRPLYKILVSVIVKKFNLKYTKNKLYRAIMSLKGVRSLKKILKYY